jgi:hypothetical protein
VKYLHKVTLMRILALCRIRRSHRVGWCAVLSLGMPDPAVNAANAGERGWAQEQKHDRRALGRQQMRKVLPLEETARVVSGARC